MRLELSVQLIAIINDKRRWMGPFEWTNRVIVERDGWGAESSMHPPEGWHKSKRVWPPFIFPFSFPRLLLLLLLHFILDCGGLFFSLPWSTMAIHAGIHWAFSSSSIHTCFFLSFHPTHFFAITTGVILQSDGRYSYQSIHCSGRSRVLFKAFHQWNDGIDEANATSPADSIAPFIRQTVNESLSSAGQ